MSDPTVPQITQVMRDVIELFAGADVSITIDNQRRDSYPGDVLSIQVRTRRVLSQREEALGVLIRLNEGPEAAAVLVADAFEKVFRHHRKATAAEEAGS